MSNDCYVYEQKPVSSDDQHLREKAMTFAVQALPDSNLDLLVLADKIYRFMKDGNIK